ncbi:hypothetical protein T261_08500 [Streptomyces lydicus]|nr:hypothetical protein T261_08500 [Streptomyces lydicus]
MTSRTCAFRPCLRTSTDLARPAPIDDTGFIKKGTTSAGVSRQ